MTACEPWPVDHGWEIVAVLAGRRTYAWLDRGLAHRPGPLFAPYVLVSHVCHQPLSSPHHGPIPARDDKPPF